MTGPDKKLHEILRAMEHGAPLEVDSEESGAPSEVVATGSAGGDMGDESTMPAQTSPTSTFPESNALRRRRTLIPILLTCGVLLPIVGSLRWLAPLDSPLAELSAPLSWTLIATGYVLLVLAGLNMYFVRREQAQQHV